MIRLRGLQLLLPCALCMLLTACGPFASQQPQATSGNQSVPDRTETTPAPKPVESLLQHFERENPGAKVLQSLEADLNKDGTPELVLAYQPPGDKGATVGVLPLGAALQNLDSINLAKFVQPLKVLDHGETVHLVVIFGYGHNFVMSLYSYDGMTVSLFWQTEADEYAGVQGNELVFQRRIYKTSGPGYDVITKVLIWDQTKKKYVVRTQ